MQAPQPLRRLVRCVEALAKKANVPLREAMDMHCRSDGYLAEDYLLLLNMNMELYGNYPEFREVD
ncbi:MAG: hypothetical protein LBQ87_07265 [Candidatus Fibromonas sp.]|nr:hypothetical protein [Candidatus Fibromonas sp.]